MRVTKAARSLKRRRESAGLTQLRLGELLGVSDVAVHYWEVGKRPIDRRTQLAINAVLPTAEHQQQGAA